MSTVTSRIGISLDGYVAGPNQTKTDPLGERGERLHDWAFPPEGQEVHPTDTRVLERCRSGIGAYIMGRNMFAGPGPGPWAPDWRGWWGDDPPYHVPVFVLTHHKRDPLEMRGGTTFHFVDDGIESALEQARAAAGDGDVHVAGGANAIQQFLAAGLLDELLLHVAPMLLGGGERLFENVGEPRLEPVEVITSPAVTHIRYRVG